MKTDKSRSQSQTALFFLGKLRGSNKGGKKLAFLFFPWRTVSACMCGRTRNGDDDDDDGGDGEEDFDDDDDGDFDC